MIISDFKPIIFSFVCSNLTNYIPSYLSFLALKGKKKLEKVKNKSRSGRPDCRSNINEVDKSKKRPAQSSKFDLTNKRSKKEGSQVPYRPNQHRVAFSTPNMSQTVYHSHPDAANVVPDFRYPNGGTGFRR